MGEGNKETDHRADGETSRRRTTEQADELIRSESWDGSSRRTRLRRKRDIRERTKSTHEKKVLHHITCIKKVCIPEC